MPVVIQDPYNWAFLPYRCSSWCQVGRECRRHSGHQLQGRQSNTGIPTPERPGQLRCSEAQAYAYVFFPTAATGVHSLILPWFNSVEALRQPVRQGHRKRLSTPHSQPELGYQRPRRCGGRNGIPRARCIREHAA